MQILLTWFKVMNFSYTLKPNILDVKYFNRFSLTVVFLMKDIFFF